MIPFDVQWKLTELNKRVFDLENQLARALPAETVFIPWEPPPWLPWEPPTDPPHALGGPRHIGVGSGLERDGTDLRVDEDAAFTWTALHTHTANIILDDGAGDSPQLQFIGGSNDDAVLMYLVDNAVVGNSDLVIRLCAADDGSQLIIQDNSPATVAYIDADGNARFAGKMIVGSLGAPASRFQVVGNAGDTQIFRLSGECSSHGLNFIYTIKNAVNVSAIRAVPNFEPTVANKDCFVLNNNASIRGSINIDTVYGQYLRLSLAAAATCTVDDFYHLYLQDLTDLSGGNATLTNQIGLNIQNLTGATNNWAISTNVGPVHFGDQVEIVGSGPADVQLIVKGAAAQSANLQEWQDIAPTTLLSVPAAGGLTFSGATGTNIITIPDNVTQAINLVDAGGLEFFRIISTDAQPVTVFNWVEADIDFRVASSGRSNALFVQGSSGNIGAKTNTPAADWHVVGGTVANKHYGSYRTVIFEDGNLALQLIGEVSTTAMVHIVLTGAPAAGDNRHWIISHFADAHFSIGYKTSSADNFPVYDPTEHFVILTNGDIGMGITPSVLLHTYKNDTDEAVNTQFRIEQDGAGDAVMDFLLTGIRQWLVGVDNSDGDKFKIVDATGGGVFTTRGIIIDPSGNVGLGTAAPAASALLELLSTTGALLLTRMTTTQRDALSAVNGMIIYNTTTTRLEARENGSWVDL